MEKQVPVWSQKGQLSMWVQTEMNAATLQSQLVVTLNDFKWWLRCGNFRLTILVGKARHHLPGKVNRSLPSDGGSGCSYKIGAIKNVFAT